jgi:hypothetical protein
MFVHGAECVMDLVDCSFTSNSAVHSGGDIHWTGGTIGFRSLFPVDSSYTGTLTVKGACQSQAADTAKEVDHRKYEPVHNGCPGYCWADKAYQIGAKQKDFDEVMAAPPEGRETVCEKLTNNEKIRAFLGFRRD